MDTFILNNAISKFSIAIATYFLLPFCKRNEYLVLKMSPLPEADLSASTANFPGIGKAVNPKRSTSSIRRSIWVGLFLMGMGLTYMQVQEVIVHYFTYPISTRVRSNGNSSYLFCCTMEAFFERFKVGYFLIITVNFRKNVRLQFHINTS